jgi:hypothetical protein
MSVKIEQHEPGIDLEESMQMPFEVSNYTTTRRFIQVCAVYFDLPLWTLFSFNLDLSWMQMKMVIPY